MDDSDNATNIEQLERYFQQQNDLDEKEEMEKGENSDSDNGHLSEDSLEESVSGYESPDKFYLDSSTPQLHFDREQDHSAPDRFTQSLPVSLSDHNVPNVPKLYEGFEYPEQLLERHWQPHVVVTEATAEQVDSDDGDVQNSEEQLRSVGSPLEGALRVQHEISRTNEEGGQLNDLDAGISEEIGAHSTPNNKSDNSVLEDVASAQLLTDEGQPVQDATAQDLQKSHDENDNHPHEPSQNASHKHTVTLDHNLGQNKVQTEENTPESTEDSTNDVTFENNDVISYVSGIGDGDHVNVMAMDGKDGETVYLIVDSDSPLTAGGDAQVLHDVPAEVNAEESGVPAAESEAAKKANVTSTPEDQPLDR